MSERTYKKHVMRVIFPCALYSASAGVVIGIVVFFFKMLAEFLGDLSISIYAYVSNNLAYIPLLIIGLVLSAIIVYFIIKKIPEASGGGIPRSEGIVRGLLSFRWLHSIIGAITGSIFAFIAGLSVGSEGPGVQIGTAIGDGFNKIYHSRGHTWKRPVLTAGAAAGFGVVTGAPISGIVFAIEEANSKYEPYLVLAAGIGVIFASVTTSLLAHLFSIDMKILNNGPITDLTFNLMWIPAIIGIIAGFGAVLYNTLIEKVSKIAGKHLSKKMMSLIYLLSIFLITGIIGLLLPQATGSGHTLIFGVLERKFIWYMLIPILLVKLLLIAGTTASGAVGGMFLPMLSIGGTIGGLIGELFLVCGLSIEFYPIIILLTICSFFGGAIYAPITATVFIIESTGSFISGLHCIIAVFLSMMIMSVFKVESVNEVTLKEILRNYHKKDELNKTTQISN
ncbi:MAG: chloride channel protein [Christensenellaceae bacterium]|jgi:H+/Cl- antiporter ClcA|nr:chloride channel protein [Christensenellaceae bacterium]